MFGTPAQPLAMFLSSFFSLASSRRSRRQDAAPISSRTSTKPKPRSTSPTGKVLQDPRVLPADTRSAHVLGGHRNAQPELRRTSQGGAVFDTHLRGKVVALIPGGLPAAVHREARGDLELHAIQRALHGARRNVPDVVPVVDVTTSAATTTEEYVHTRRSHTLAYTPGSAACQDILPSRATLDTRIHVVEGAFIRCVAQRLVNSFDAPTLLASGERTDDKRRGVSSVAPGGISWQQGSPTGEAHLDTSEAHVYDSLPRQCGW